MFSNFLDYFETNEYDNNILLKKLDKKYTVKEVKTLVYSQMCYLKEMKSNNIIVGYEDNFSFIINMLACVFLGKDIYIVNSNNQILDIPDSILVDSLASNILHLDFDFPKVDIEDTYFYIYTSGTTSIPKVVKKNLCCFLKESSDIVSLFKSFKRRGLEFISTTSLNYLFGLTFYLFLPLNTQNVINTNRIIYPEDLYVKNSVLVTTPSFLSMMNKYDCVPEEKPSLIITAGSKLDVVNYEYAQSIASGTIDIYGSTETGIIGYRHNHCKDYFSLFPTIKIVKNGDDGTIIESGYSTEKEDFLGDRIDFVDGKIMVLGRTDRIFKIQEKRVSINEIEDKLKKSDYISSCYCVEFSNKIGAIVELSELGIQFLLENDMPKLIKKLKSYLRCDFTIIPQSWKFIDCIPKTSRGKYDKDKIDEIFNTNLSLPLITKRYVEDNYAEFDIYFYKHCNFFQGHFDKFPIVPGVVQLFYANYFVKDVFNMDCHIGRIRRIKFSNIIRADSEVKLILKKTETNISYEYRKDDKIYSSGSLGSQECINV